MDNFVCKICLRAIKSADIAASDKSQPIIKCCKCLLNTCCIDDCDKKYRSVNECTKLNIKFDPRCLSHRLDHMCNHSHCSRFVESGRFCCKHKCFGFFNNTPCGAEAVSKKNFCAFHLNLYKKDEDVKKDKKTEVEKPRLRIIRRTGDTIA